MALTFKFKPGDFVRHDGERYIVIEISDLRLALCRCLATKATAHLPLAELVPDAEDQSASPPRARQVDLATVPQQNWDEATATMIQIRKLAAKGRHRRSAEEIAEVARELECSSRTVHRLLAKYDRMPSVEVFFSKERADKGRGRLANAVEEVIAKAIRSTLMKREYGTYKDTHLEVKRICLEKNLHVPGMWVIRDRFLSISEADRVASRHGNKKAKEKFTPLMGSFPGADYPLAVVQIDHTPADLIIVDDIYRKSIGRPYLTLAIDVFSRMVMGFNLWLEAPSAASVGICLHHAMLSKEQWLEKVGVRAEWNCYGRPKKIHTDNAKEFRGTVLGRACQKYGIDLEQRPKGQPHFGGHVERGFRTYLRKMHEVSGTTFSNTKSKFEYDAEGKAIMTLAEFEKWFTIYLTKKYHVDMHDGINTTPTARFVEGIMGSDDRPGIGVPERFTDPEQVRLDFLPFVERTVQEYGVLIDHITYYDDILRSRIHEKDPDNPKQARKFIFRRDPRDVSVIYFWDPDLNTYSEIHTANRSRPPVSLWEVRAVVRELIAKGKSHVNEALIFEGVDEMREIETQAAEKTKSARRNQQRRAQAEKHRKQKETASTTPAGPAKEGPASPEAKPMAPTTDSLPELYDDDEEILPFEDIVVRR